MLFFFSSATWTHCCSKRARGEARERMGTSVWGVILLCETLLGKQPWTVLSMSLPTGWCTCFVVFLLLLFISLGSCAVLGTGIALLSTPQPCAEHWCWALPGVCSPGGRGVHRAGFAMAEADFCITRARALLRKAWGQQGKRPSALLVLSKLKGVNLGYYSAQPCSLYSPPCNSARTFSAVTNSPVFLLLFPVV